MTQSPASTSLTKLSPLTPDLSFASPASRETLNAVAKALLARGIAALVVADREAARTAVHGLIPRRPRVQRHLPNARHHRIADDIVAAERYQAARTLIDTLNLQTQFDDYRRAVASPQVVVGSVHAVTRDGELIIASATGSQLASYAFGSGEVIWVIGAQKVVGDVAQGLERVQRYSYPLEDERARAVYGGPSEEVLGF